MKKNDNELSINEIKAILIKKWTESGTSHDESQRIVDESEKKVNTFLNLCIAMAMIILFSALFLFIKIMIR